MASPSSSSPSQEMLLFSIVEYLRGISSSFPALPEALKALEDSLLLDATGDAKLRERCSIGPADLMQVFEAGLQAGGFKTLEQQRKEVEASPQFQAFLTAVTNKGYFEGHKPGSDEYQERYDKVLVKYGQKKAAASATAVPPPPPAAVSNEDDEASAEAAKTEGNEFIKNKEYGKALECYTRALDLSPEGPQSHVYLCNRAAAKCFLAEWDDAADDCLASIDLSPQYVKAYSRLGYVYFNQEDYSAAVKAYEKAVELEPGNRSHSDALKKAKAKAKAKVAAATRDAGGAGPMGNMNDIMSAMGGAGGLEGLMQNPQLMQMAQGMMQNPEMMKMAQGMMQNPAMMQNMMNMVGGGQGGMGPAGVGASSAPPSFGGPGLASSDMSSLGSALDSEADDAEDDPDITRLEELMKTQGPMAAMAAVQNNPELMQKAMKLMQERMS
jgi:small glutamine-rich tetratricopeptide repeat-containing protein alpha